MRCIPGSVKIVLQETTCVLILLVEVQRKLFTDAPPCVPCLSPVPNPDWSTKDNSRMGWTCQIARLLSFDLVCGQWRPPSSQSRVDKVGVAVRLFVVERLPFALTFALSLSKLLFWVPRFFRDLWSWHVEKRLYISLLLKRPRSAVCFLEDLCVDPKGRNPDDTFALFEAPAELFVVIGASLLVFQCVDDLVGVVRLQQLQRAGQSVLLLSLDHTHTRPLPHGASAQWSLRDDLVQDIRLMGTIVWGNLDLDVRSLLRLH